MGSQGSPVKSYDYLLKFLLVGDSDVGKGEILDSLQDGSAESPYAYSSGESPRSRLTSGWCDGDDGVCVAQRPPGFRSLAPSPPCLCLCLFSHSCVCFWLLLLFFLWCFIALQLKSHPCQSDYWLCFSSKLHCCLKNKAANTHKAESVLPRVDWRRLMPTVFFSFYIIDSSLLLFLQ